MNIFKLSWFNLKANALSTVLNIILLSFGIGIIAVLLLTGFQLEQKLTANSKNIDAVVGAKGSPLQLILSSVYHIDFPTGNIPLEEVKELLKNRAIKRAVPMALGDSYENFRIVGTDTSFYGLYELEIDEGALFANLFDVNIGANVAKIKGLKLGDKIKGSHGLTTDGDVHDEHDFTITGILKPTGSVADNLVLTSIATVWATHEEHDHADDAPHSTDTTHKHAEEHNHDKHSHDHDAAEHIHGEDCDHGEEEPFHENVPYLESKRENREITALLIQYRGPAAIVSFPRFVNQQTIMQAASPAMESARLFSLIGVGLKSLQAFGILIVIISALSVFISLYNSLKDRKYDLAIIRTMGASRLKLFTLIILEGLFLSAIATIVGILWAHLALEWVGSLQDSEQARLTGFIFIAEEVKLIIAGIVVGIVAALLPAIQAYKTDISRILAKK